MKFAVYFTMLFIAAFSCKESESSNSAPNKEKFASKECFEVSYVTGICGQAVLKIENPDFYKLGETWNEHTNVFYTVFDCSVDEMKLKQTKFFVTIGSNSDTDCARCFAALDYSGSKKHAVTVVANCGGSSDN